MGIVPLKEIYLSWTGANYHQPRCQVHKLKVANTPEEEINFFWPYPRRLDQWQWTGSQPLRHYPDEPSGIIGKMKQLQNPDLLWTVIGTIRACQSQNEQADMVAQTGEKKKPCFTYFCSLDPQTWGAQVNFLLYNAYRPFIFLRIKPVLDMLIIREAQEARWIHRTGHKTVRTLSNNIPIMMTKLKPANVLWRDTYVGCNKLLLLTTYSRLLKLNTNCCTATRNARLVTLFTNWKLQMYLEERFSKRLVEDICIHYGPFYMLACIKQEGSAEIDSSHCAFVTHPLPINLTFPKKEGAAA